MPSNGNAAYHPGRARVLLCTDWGRQYTGEEDVAPCEWDGSRWVMRNPRTPLTGRAQFGWAASPSGSMLLFGGSTSNGYRDETWEWDGDDWRLLVPAARPSGRRLPTMAFDSWRGRTVLFGGTGAGNLPLNDTWEWTGTTWVQRFPPTSPPASYRQPAAFDSRRGVTVLLTTAPAGPAQTWEWNGVQWLRRTTANTPTASDWQFLCFDSRRGVCLLVQQHAADLETWQWDGIDWSPLGTSRITSPTWVSLAFDEGRGVPVLFTTTEGDHPGAFEWDGQTWRRVSSVNPLPDWSGAPSLAYDLVRGRTVLFGGWPNDAVWEWDGEAWAEVDVRPAPTPPGRSVTGLAYDLARARTVLFGGIGMDGGYVADTWEWDGLRWVQRSVPGPSPRWARLAYDISRRRTVLFGGLDRTGSLADTWEWDGAVWTSMRSSNSPPPGLQALAYDVARGRTMCLAYSQAGALELWEWDGGNWTNRTVAVMPSARGSAGLTYDWSRQRLVMFGGGYVTGWPNWFTVCLNDSWEWDGATWQLVPLAPTTAPTPRLAPALVYDSRRARTVLFGGCEDRSTSHVSVRRCRADTWEIGPDAEAATIAYGRPCRGSTGYPALTAVQRPVLGNSNFALRASSLPPFSPVMVALGAQPASQPWAPECALLVRPSFVTLLQRSDGVGSVSVPMPVPVSQSLLRASIYSQAAAPDRVSGVTATGGLQMRLGL